jgi:hypothetical protein
VYYNLSKELVLNRQQGRFHNLEAAAPISKG